MIILMFWKRYLKKIVDCVFTQIIYFLIVIRENYFLTFLFCVLQDTKFWHPGGAEILTTLLIGLVRSMNRWHPFDTVMFTGWVLVGYLPYNTYWKVNIEPKVEIKQKVIQVWIVIFPNVLRCKREKNQYNLSNNIIS